MGAIISLIYLAVIVLTIAGIWKTYEKAGEPGWTSIVPIYDIVVMLKMAGKPTWWILLFFIPPVNVIVGIMVVIALAQRFGKSGKFAVGLILLPFIFYPMLGFGDAQYDGSSGASLSTAI